MSYIEYILYKGRVAVVTGAASGIGLAACKAFASKGMNVFMADVNEPLLADAEKQVKAVHGVGSVNSMKVDVSNLEDVTSMKDKVMELFGEVAVLMNNAALLDLSEPTFSFTKKPEQLVENWRKMVDVNVLGVLNGTAVFAPIMSRQENSSIIINTGSKQGITCPPGNAVYNTCKSAVKTLTEQLAHELRNVADAKCSAHLLIPGWAHTGERSRTQPKPPGAWTAEQVIQYMLQKLDVGSFYILCPDNDVSVELDKLRMSWALGDIIDDRPALSRWHPEWKGSFNDFVKSGLGLQSRSASRGRSPAASSAFRPDRDNL